MSSLVHFVCGECSDQNTVCPHEQASSNPTVGVADGDAGAQFGRALDPAVGVDNEPAGAQNFSAPIPSVSVDNNPAGGLVGCAFQEGAIPVAVVPPMPVSTSEDFSGNISYSLENSSTSGQTSSSASGHRSGSQTSSTIATPKANQCGNQPSTSRAPSRFTVTIVNEQNGSPSRRVVGVPREVETDNDWEEYENRTYRGNRMQTYMACRGRMATVGRGAARRGMSERGFVGRGLSGRALSRPGLSRREIWRRLLLRPGRLVQRGSRGAVMRSRGQSAPPSSPPSPQGQTSKK